MQSAGLPAVEFENKLLNSADKSVLFGAVIATNELEAESLIARLTNLPSVGGVESITKYMSGDQTEKLKLVQGIKMELKPISSAGYQAGGHCRTEWDMFTAIWERLPTKFKDEPGLAKQLTRCAGQWGAAQRDAAWQRG